MKNAMNFFVISRPDSSSSAGIAHGDELLYMFGFPAEFNEADALQTRNMVKTWVDFARTG